MVKSIENNFTYAKSLIGKPRTCLEVISHQIHVPLPPEYLSDVKDAVMVVLRDELKIYSPELNGVPVAFNEKSAKLSENYGTYIGSQPYIHCDVLCEYIVFKPKVGDLLEGIVNKCKDTQITCVIHGCFFGTIHKKKSQHQTVKVDDKITVRVTTLDEDGDGILSLKCSLHSDTEQPPLVGNVSTHVDEIIDGIVFYACKTADDGIHSSDIIVPSILSPQPLFSDSGSQSESLLSPVRGKGSKKQIKHPSKYMEGDSTANESVSAETTQGFHSDLMKLPAKEVKKRKSRGKEKPKKNGCESHTSDTDATTATTLSFSSHRQRLLSSSENLAESTQSQPNTVPKNSEKLNSSSSPQFNTADDPFSQQTPTIKLHDIHETSTPKELISPSKAAKKRKTATTESPTKRLKGSAEAKNQDRSLLGSTQGDGKENPNSSLQNWLNTAPCPHLQKAASQPLKWTSCDSIDEKMTASLTTGDTSEVGSSTSQSKRKKVKSKKKKEKKQKKAKRAKKDKSKSKGDESVFLSPPKVQVKEEIATGDFQTISPTDPSNTQPQNLNIMEEDHRRQALFHLQKLGINLPLHMLTGSSGHQAASCSVTSTATPMSPIVASSAAPNTGAAVSGFITSTPFIRPQVEEPASAVLFTYDKLHGVNVAGGKKAKVGKKEKRKKDKKSVRKASNPPSASMNDSGLDSLSPAALITSVPAVVLSPKQENSSDSSRKKKKKKEKKKKHKKEEKEKTKQKVKKSKREKKKKEAMI